MEIKDLVTAYQYLCVNDFLASQASCLPRTSTIQQKRIFLLGVLLIKISCPNETGLAGLEVNPEKLSLPIEQLSETEKRARKVLLETVANALLLCETAHISTVEFSQMVEESQKKSLTDTNKIVCLFLPGFPEDTSGNTLPLRSVTMALAYQLREIVEMAMKNGALHEEKVLLLAKNYSTIIFYLFNRKEYRVFLSYLPEVLH